MCSVFVLDIYSKKSTKGNGKIAEIFVCAKKR